MNEKNSERISRTLAGILLHLPVLGYITSRWKVQESENTKTIATNYRTLIYNPDFVNSLSDGELVGVLLHEAFHCLFLHPTEVTRVQKRDKDPRLWEIAEEIVVNAAVVSLLEMHHLGKLPGIPVSPLQENTCTKNDQKGKHKGYYYYDRIGNKYTTPEIYRMLAERFSQKQDMQICSPLAGDVLPAEDRNDAHEAVETAIAVISEMSRRHRGNLPGGITRFLSELTAGRIPWRRILHAFVNQTCLAGTDDFSWTRPNFKHPLSEEIVVPGEISREIDPLVVVVDTSASITDQQLRVFASEAAALMRKFPEADIMLITTDAAVQERVHMRSPEDLISRVKFKGGGGTDFREVFSLISSLPGYTPVVFFTDGDALYPEKPPGNPVLWILTGCHVRPPFGRVAYMLDV